VRTTRRRGDARTEMVQYENPQVGNNQGGRCAREPNHNEQKTRRSATSPSTQTHLVDAARVGTRVVRQRAISSKHGL
jgi:hypothetical protein